MSAFRGFGVAWLILLMTGASSVLAQTPSDRLAAEGPTLDTMIDGKLQRNAWNLDRKANPDVLSVEIPPGQIREVCLISGPQSLCRTITLGQQHDFFVHFDGFDYPTRIAARPPAAVFNAAYQAENRGQTQILIPEVYELVNIAIALTQRGREDPYLVAKDTSYYTEMTAHFGAYQDHPLVLALQADMQQDPFRYFRIKMNGYAFEFGEGDQIVRSEVYERTGFSGDHENVLLPYLPLLQSFADDTGFRDFYRVHKPFYDTQIEYYREQIDVAGALAWLQANFPAVKPYDSNKIIFSPLVYGSQSLTTFSSNGFTELQPHVNFPYPGQDDEGLSPKGVALRRGSILFTEMNHGFINPSVAPFAAEVREIFADRAFWTIPQQLGNNYGSPLSLFNEYMNWALISLYLQDKADSADRALMIPRLEKLMEERGFAQFHEFNQFLLSLYIERVPGTTVADLYPQIVRWTLSHHSAKETA